MGEPREISALSPTTARIESGYGVYYSPILYNNLQFSMLYAPNFVLQSKSFSISSPVVIENLLGPTASGKSGYTIDRTLKDQSAQEWNFEYRALPQQQHIVYFTPRCRTTSSIC
jgi:hypothetical protein